MYPLNTTAPWPRNQWYVAGIAAELTNQPIGRTFLGHRVVMYRGIDGQPLAFSGLCPHRMMPLELGTVREGELECPYHGLRFDGTGTCVAAPTAPSVPNTALRPYPIREASPLLWIWMGDPELAASVPLPPQEDIGLGAPGWCTQSVKYTALPARYLLLIDNLFDLSHLGFIHASIVGDAQGLPLIEPKIEERDGRLLVAREVFDVPTDGYQRFLFPEMGKRMSVRIETEMVGISLINAGGPAWNGADANAPLTGHMNFIHAVTPETETTTHYWTLLARDFRQDDEALSTALAQQNTAVLAQDITALSAIEERLQLEKSLPKEISMKPDQGALRARLRVIQLIRDEEQGKPVSAAA